MRQGLVGRFELGRAVALEQQHQQPAQARVRRAQFRGHVIDEALVMAALPRLLARLQPLLLARDEQLDQDHLRRAPALARLVDHVDHILCPRAQRVVHHPAVVASGLAFHLLADVLVILGAVALRRRRQLALGSRADRRDQLVVVAAEAQEAAVHRLVDGLGIRGGNKGLELLIVALQLHAHLLHDVRVLVVILACPEHRGDEGQPFGARLDGLILR